MDIYLHVGTWKTGTTALQNFLYRNAYKLKRNHIHYPGFGLRGKAHHRFAFAFETCTNKKMITCDLTPWRILSKQIFPSGSKIVISSESLYSVVLQASNRHIKKYLSSFNIKIVVYLRPQEDLLESGFRNQIKGGKIKNFVEHTQNSRLYYHRQLGHISKVFGKENLIVRIYDKNRFQGGNIFCDFLHAIGAEWDDNYMLPEDQLNKSISNPLLCFLLKANRIDRELDNKRRFNLLLKSLVEEYEVFKDAPRTTLFTKNALQQIREKYKASNAELQKDYFPQYADLFSPRAYHFNEDDYFFEGKPDDARTLYTLFARHFEVEGDLCNWPTANYDFIVKATVELFEQNSNPLNSLANSSVSVPKIFK